ncbi:MAG TPA: chromosome partitioning protein, partial [Allosphingosinicella sp.]|nr:chromosome partitioning protein [Allosphingosinicella sp.]
MNKHSPLSHSGSLLERAAELYGFGSASAAPAKAPSRAPVAEPEVSLGTEPAPRPIPGPAAAEEPDPGLRRGAENSSRAFLPVVAEPKAEVDRKSLGARGFIVPDSPAGPLAEEFRIVKRQLLLGMGAGSSVAADKRRTILVCSAQPDEGKTFCAVNLALSLAGERDMEVLLVDADFPKPEVLSIL